MAAPGLPAHREAPGKGPPLTDPRSQPGHEPEQPVYERFDSRAGYLAAVERLLEQPGRELRVFDPDLSSLQLNDPERVQRLERFLMGRTRRLFIVVHETDHVTRRSARFMTLLARYSHAIQVNRTHEQIRRVQDAFLVLDAAHYVRRPAAQFYRGAVGLGDEAEGLAMRNRFMEIWEASYPAVSATTAGL